MSLLVATGCDLTPAAWLNTALSSGVNTFVGALAQNITASIFGETDDMMGDDMMGDEMSSGEMMGGS